MSNAEQNSCLNPWKSGIPSPEQHYIASAPAYSSEEDQVAWPPVIARIRDLDKPATPENMSAVLATEKRTPAKPLSAKKPLPRWGQKISSRIIALTGIFIFILALMPFMHLRDNKSNSDLTNTAWQSPTPASNAGPTATQPGGNANTAGTTGKTSSQNVAAPPTSQANTAKPPADVKPNPPPLLTPPEKKDTPEGPLANQLPAQVNPPAALTQPGTPLAGTAAPTAIPSDPTTSLQPNAEAEAGFSRWPNVAQPKAEALNAGNQTVQATPDPSQGLPAMPTGPGTPGMPSNQPFAPGMTAPQAVTGAMPPNPNMPANYSPYPPVNGPGAEVRGTYQQADLRNDYLRQNQYTPPYRMNSAPDYRAVAPANVQYPPNNGQYPPAANQYPPATGQYAPVNGQYAPAGGRAGMSSSQVPAQANPNPAVPLTYPANHLTYPPNPQVPYNPAPGTAAGAGQSGGYAPAPNYNNNPNAVPAGYPDGYRIPPTN